MVDHAAAFDREDVESRFRVGREKLEKIFSNGANPRTLTPVDRRQCGTEGVRRAGLHLDEHDGRAVERDDVDLSSRSAQVPPHDAVPERGEVRGREILGRRTEAPYAHGAAVASNRLGAFCTGQKLRR